MFQRSDYLTMLDLSHYTTTKATNMKAMFQGCHGIRAIIFGSSWKTENVEDMSQMFEFCELLTSLEISNFDTSSVKTMKAMFQGCIALKFVNVANYQTQNVEDMSSLFSYTALESLTLNWDTRNVKDMKNMFLRPMSKIWKECSTNVLT